MDFKAKEKSIYDHYTAITEFFINSANIETGEEKGFSKRTYLGHENKYEEHYWEVAAKHPNFKPLPKVIEDEINFATQKLP